MIPVKIQCGCGQRYAFEVEPILGQMPSSVACPGCGADGTAMANLYLAQTMPSPIPVAAVAASVRAAPVRVAVSAPSTAAAPVVSTIAARSAAPLVGQLDPSQIEHETRAKILWGDEPDEVVKYLVVRGVDPDQAAAAVHVMLKERASAIRINGIKKIVIGAALVCIPVFTLIMFIKIGAISFTILGITGAVGLWGAWMIFKGLFMVLSPKSEAGDVSEQ